MWDDHVLTAANLNPHLISLEYAVRGPVVTRANELTRELQSGVSPKHFTRVVKANIGDCHATGQVPITFLRQVVALCSYPQLLETDFFPQDAKDRARRILAGCKGGSVGSYSESPGILIIRKDIAKYIEERDGYPADVSNIKMCTGASDGIRTIMNLLLTGVGGQEAAGFMIPVPQYPLYSAALEQYGAYIIPYYLSEENQWSMDVSELERALREARPFCKPRAIVIINPGNPTGQVLSKENIQDVIKFAKKEKLFLMADEVYQHNVYKEGAEFYSFKRVLMEMGTPFNQMELASFMSASKGYMGECGFRAGYTEVINLDPDVHAHLNKLITTKLCPPVIGQVALDCSLCPPNPGDPSYPLFKSEFDRVLADLKAKAKFVSNLFNSIDGISCNEVQGAMYAFPRVHLPDKAIAAATEAGQTPDTFYCFALLEETGICTVPGCGFKEKKGTYHFRITILPPIDELKQTLATFKTFHLRFFENYS